MMGKCCLENIEDLGKTACGNSVVPKNSGSAWEYLTILIYNHDYCTSKRYRKKQRHMKLKENKLKKLYRSA